MNFLVHKSSPSQSEHAHCLENKTVVAGVQRERDKFQCLTSKHWKCLAVTSEIIVSTRRLLKGSVSCASKQRGRQAKACRPLVPLEQAHCVPGAGGPH